MRLKLMAFFLTLFGVFAALLVLRASHILNQTQNTAESSVAKSQTRAAAVSFEERLHHLQQAFYLSWSVATQEKKDFSGESFTPFLMMAKLTGEPSQSNFEERYFRAKTEISSWAPVYVQSFLKNLKPDEIHTGAVYAYTILDPQRKPYGLLLFSRNNPTRGTEFHVAVTSGDVFQAFLDLQKGQSVSFFLVNTLGQVLAHPTKDYVGTSMNEDPAVAAVINGGGDSKSLSSPLASSNLYLIATPAAGTSTGSFIFQVVLMAVGFLLIGGVGLYYFYKPEKEIVHFNQASTGAQQVSVGPETSTHEGESEKVKYAESVAASLAHELMAPCTSILGHARLAWARLEHTLGAGKFEEVGYHLQKLEEEARASRSILQKLLTFAGEEKEQPTRAQVDTVVIKALQNIELAAQSKGIKVHRKLQDSTQMLMPVHLFTKAIESILENAIEAMDRVIKKDLTVELTSEGDSSVLRISDTGEGISAENLSKIFDPFFTTKSHQRHTGLGLATALGIVKELQGKINVQSELGKGTQIEVRWPHKGYEQYINHADAPMINLQALLPSAPKASMDAIKEVLAKPESADLALAKVPVEPLLVDDSVEKMIDEDLAVDPTDMHMEVEEIEGNSTVRDSNGFSGKIDRPNIAIKKKPSKLDSVKVNIPKSINKSGESS